MGKQKTKRRAITNLLLFTLESFCETAVAQAAPGKLFFATPPVGFLAGSSVVSVFVSSSLRMVVVSSAGVGDLSDGPTGKPSSVRVVNVASSVLLETSSGSCFIAPSAAGSLMLAASNGAQDLLKLKHPKQAT